MKGSDAWKMHLTEFYWKFKAFLKFIIKIAVKKSLIRFNFTHSEKKNEKFKK